MQFLYKGDTSLDVRIPGEQYARTINPSKNPYTTNDKVLFDFLMSAENPNKALFEDPNAPKPASRKKATDTEVTGIG
jgi:hypothetical protein